jgi:hypothetical protein
MKIYLQQNNQELDSTMHVYNQASHKKHVAESAETFVYRKDPDGNWWKVVRDGLPEPRGSTMMSFTSNVKVSGEFYAVNKPRFIYLN